MNDNKLILASAGSGKTTFLVDHALKLQGSVLITTYTEANAREIQKKIINILGYIPHTIHIQTWFSFLLQHGVRPYQDLMHPKLFDRKIGFYLVNRRSGYRGQSKSGHPTFWGKKNFFKYYFTPDLQIYSDKVSAFIVECDQKTKGRLIQRISRIYTHILIDEVQDLAGYDLEIIKRLLKSPSSVLLVGDPRQVVYLTHHPKKYSKYSDGKIDEFINDKCKDLCTVDDNTLNESHRNNKEICEFSSSLYPEYEASLPCSCNSCRKVKTNHKGIFLVRESEVQQYCKLFPNIVVLKERLAVYPEWNYGKSKGLSFDRVLIYPTQKIKDYIENGSFQDISTIRSKFYVAITRARHSVAIVYDYNSSTDYGPYQKFVAYE